MSELNKLRWRCRRGSLELDVLLLRYLDTTYLSSSELEKQAFVRLLKLEDVQLLSYLMGNVVPEDAGLARLVEIIMNRNDRLAMPHIPSPLEQDF